MGKLTRQQLEGLNLYKYSGVDKQVLNLYRCDSYWRWLTVVLVSI